MAKLRNWIGNLKVAAKLKVYRMAVLVMTAFFVLVAPNSGSEPLVS